MPKLDERARRRPDWREGFEVTLGDGGVWHLRHPPYRRSPRRSPDGGFEFGEPQRPRFDGLIEQMLDAEDGMVQINTALNIAVLLLEENYILAPDDIEVLLPWSHTDEANVEMWHTVLGVAIGNLVPKA